MELSSENQMRIVVPGDYVDEGYIAGHGTYEHDKKIYASLAGVVHRIDKVICVRPLKTSFKPDIGDVIVGRVVNVENKRWTVDINSYQHAILNLTSINLPGGFQRRRSEEDKLHMREYFKENDIICAEVQSINSHDGKINIQARNLKYGKLVNGFLIKVDHNYVRRMKSHILEFFQDQPQSVSSIIGTNGYIWIYTPDKQQQNDQLPRILSISKETRVQMSTLRNAVIALEKSQVPIFKDTIQKVLDSQKQRQFTPQEMLMKIEQVTSVARDMIETEINLKKPMNLQVMMNDMNQQDFIMQ